MIRHLNGILTGIKISLRHKKIHLAERWTQNKRYQVTGWRKQNIKDIIKKIMPLGKKLPKSRTTAPTC